MDSKDQDKQPTRQLDPATTTISIGTALPDGRDVEIDIPLREVFAAYLTIQQVGYNNAVGLLNFWVGATEELSKKEVKPAGTSARSILRLLEDRRSPVDVTRKERERRVLEFCYLLRTRMQITLTKSADIASALLEEQIEPEAWRKKLERYAEREKKPQPGKPRRKRRHT